MHGLHLLLEGLQGTSDEKLVWAQNYSKLFVIDYHS